MVKCACASKSFLEAPYCEIFGKTRIVQLLTEELPDLGENFTVIEKIGEGGMGIVYLVEQHHPMHRLLALKIIRDSDANKDVMARFFSEYQAMAWLNHPFIAQIYSSGSTSTGRPYYTMEHLPGCQIVSYCRIRRLALTERLLIFLKICEGVKHAHLRGIIHRDLKPSNIIIIEQNHIPTPKIIDFGIAKSVNGISIGSPCLQHDNQFVVGTPSYMSPEQAKNQGKVDTRTDVYSLGTILYELLCGRPPLQLDETHISINTLLRKIQHFRVTPPSVVWSKDPIETKEATGLSVLRTRALDSEVDAIIRKALAKQADQRYESVQDLASDIESLLIKSRFIPTELFRKFVAWLTTGKSLHRSQFGKRQRHHSQAARWHHRGTGIEDRRNC